MYFISGNTQEEISASLGLAFMFKESTSYMYSKVEFRLMEGILNSTFRFTFSGLLLRIKKYTWSMVEQLRNG